MKSIKKTTARAHHFLSQCYLKRFTKLGTKKSSLTTLDLATKNIFCTIPKNIAQERDFNRIDRKGLDPDYLESELSSFESTAETAIYNIESTRKFEGENRIILLNLMALFAIRNPTRRDWWNSIIDRETKLLLSMATQNIGTRSNGVLITEDIKKILEEDNFKVVASTDSHIDLELSMLNTIIHCLVSRKWLLIEAPSDALFITCDNPVVLFWIEPHKYRSSPGFGSRGTQIHFALSKKFALVGEFDGAEGTLLASKDTVALINSNIQSHAEQWVYSADKDFYFINRAGDTLYGIENFWKEFNLNRSEVS